MTAFKPRRQLVAESMKSAIAALKPPSIARVARLLLLSAVVLAAIAAATVHFLATAR